MQLWQQRPAGHAVHRVRPASDALLHLPNPTLYPADAGIQPDGEWRRREVPLSVAPAAAGAAAHGQGPAAQPAVAAARAAAAHDAAGCGPGGGGLAELCRVLQREERAALRAALAEAADACALRQGLCGGGPVGLGNGMRVAVAVPARRSVTQQHIATGSSLRDSHSTLALPVPRFAKRSFADRPCTWVATGARQAGARAVAGTGARKPC
jgi:hypothetical protein